MSDWKNNRPPDWEKIKPKMYLAIESTELDGQFVRGYERGVEAGADAMLGALKAQVGTVYCHKGDEAIYSYELDKSGWLIFIPWEVNNAIYYTAKARGA